MNVNDHYCNQFNLHRIWLKDIKSADLNNTFAHMYANIYMYRYKTWNKYFSISMNIFELLVYMCMFILISLFVHLFNKYLLLTSVSALFLVLWM